jgi:hypothetical protein
LNYATYSRIFIKFYAIFNKGLEPILVVKNDVIEIASFNATGINLFPAVAPPETAVKL